MAGTTVDTLAVARAMRLRLLTYRSATGAPTLAERLSGGLHRGSPPDNADFPYGAFRVLNLRPHPVDGPYFVADVELMLFYRPRSDGDALQDATDVAVEALTTYDDDPASLADGVFQVDVRDRDELPPFTESADPEVIQSRVTFSVVLFPVPVT